MKNKTNTHQYSFLRNEVMDETEYLTQIFKFIAEQSFTNELNLEPRICKLVITLHLLGVPVNELTVIFNVTPKTVYKYITFTKLHLQDAIASCKITS